MMELEEIKENIGIALGSIEGLDEDLQFHAFKIIFSDLMKPHLRPSQSFCVVHMGPVDKKEIYEESGQECICRYCWNFELRRRRLKESELSWPQVEWIIKQLHPIQA